MKWLISILLALVASVGVANASYRVSLLTCGPGDAIYAIYGHSAMRVADTVTGYEQVYNFGTFDFSTPGFVMKFVRGDLDYFVDTERFDRFVAAQRYGNVTYIKEQVLNLTDAQAAAIAAELQRRSLPENRYYKYKFLQRNCTTELRDIIVANITADTAWLNAPDVRTYRKYLNRCMEGHPWVATGVNMLLGSRVDRDISRFEAMCLPEQLLRGLDRMDNGDMPLVAETIDIYSSPEAAEKKGWWEDLWFLPTLLFTLLFMALVLMRSKVADSIYFIAMGLLGCLLLFLLFYGTHMEFKDNFNVLWCNPLYLPLGIAVLLGKEKISKLLGIVLIVCMAAAFFVFMVGIQDDYHQTPATVMLMAMIILHRVWPKFLKPQK